LLPSSFLPLGQDLKVIVEAAWNVWAAAGVSQSSLK